MRMEKTFGFAVLTIFLMSILTLPLGFASHPPGPPLKYAPSMTSGLFVASNPSGSCASLGLKAGAMGYAQFEHGTVYVYVQKTTPYSFFNVTVIKLGNGESDKSWICGTTSKSVGLIKTDHLGNGQLNVQFKASTGQRYVVELLDSNGKVVYSTYSISM